MLKRVAEDKFHDQWKGIGTVRKGKRKKGGLPCVFIRKKMELAGQGRRNRQESEKSKGQRKKPAVGRMRK